MAVRRRRRRRRNINIKLYTTYSSAAHLNTPTSIIERRVQITTEPIKRRKQRKKGIGAIGRNSFPRKILGRKDVADSSKDRVYY
jgi:hypothetical protein